MDALACGALKTSSVAYQAVVTLTNTAYDRGWVPQLRLPCRVVSVGNLTVGGTGKTACTELITQKLLALGRRVAVLSRGYGGARRHYWLQWDAGRLMVDGRAASADDGLADEPQLLARHLAGVPILVGAQRSQTGRIACERFRADTVVLDDGFQHRQVHRDCDIVLVQARMPLGGWALLPRGPMREPMQSIRRAHVIIVTKADESLTTLSAYLERLRALNPDAVVAAAAHEPVGLVQGVTGASSELKQLEGKQVGLVSSIGDPAGFEATVRALHAVVAWHQAFPDHHRYRAGDVDAVLARARAARLEGLVTTEKDFVRLAPWVTGRAPDDLPWWVVRVRMQLFRGASALDDRLASLYAR